MLKPIWFKLRTIVVIRVFAKQLHTNLETVSWMQHKMETKIIGKKEEHLKTKKTEASVKLWDSKFSDNNQDTAENDT